MKTADFFTVTTLSNVKTYEAIEKGGFVIEDMIAAFQLKKPAKYIALLKFLPDEKRGNHYHKQKTEVFLFLEGEADVMLQHVDGEEKVMIKVRAGQALTIKPKCAHTFMAINGPLRSIEMSDSEFDSDDIYAKILV